MELILLIGGCVLLSVVTARITYARTSNIFFLVALSSAIMSGFAAWFIVEVKTPSPYQVILPILFSIIIGWFIASRVRIYRRVQRTKKTTY